MSKFRCRCDHVISDSVYPSPTAGWFYTQEDEDVYQTEIENYISGFIEAIAGNKRDEWIRGFFSNDYPSGLTNTSVISDIISRIQSKFVLSVYRCEKCGRIHVQEKPGLDEYKTYKPENGNG